MSTQQHVAKPFSVALGSWICKPQPSLSMCSALQQPLQLQTSYTCEPLRPVKHTTCANRKTTKAFKHDPQAKCTKTTYQQTQPQDLPRRKPHVALQNALGLRNVTFIRFVEEYLRNPWNSSSPKGSRELKDLGRPHHDRRHARSTPRGSGVDLGFTLPFRF